MFTLRPEGSGCTFPHHKETCGVGYFCPAGTHDPRSLPCPAGSYSSAQGLTSQAGCAPCPQGAVCPSLAQATYDLCPVGHYCPSSGAALGTPCPAGTYNPQYEGWCQGCPWAGQGLLLFPRGLRLLWLGVF
ncbi:Cytadherence high molecular weight protein 2, related [Eimeria brunetti]|uniref:Cytadherence high molecular weight protein 2, related n=1 Tax=Eimeria brunetti TaxID=51314 RepID=U6LIL8_9EIME|nr:Cytadherence high molecular weight protein 2, related [Eimeria brunetti]